VNKNLSYKNPYSPTDSYRPVVPKWVAEILMEEKKDNVFASEGRTKKWREWKSRYSRKLKYARLNGWIVEEATDNDQ